MSPKTNLIVSGVLFTVVLVAWPVMMTLASPTGGIEQQLHWVAGHALLFKMQFLLALLIAPAIVYLMLAQLNMLQTADSVSKRFGMVFLGAYVVLNGVSYASQAVLLPRFLAAGQMDLARAGISPRRRPSPFCKPVGLLFPGHRRHRPFLRDFSRPEAGGSHRRFLYAVRPPFHIRFRRPAVREPGLHAPDHAQRPGAARGRRADRRLGDAKGSPLSPGSLFGGEDDVCFYAISGSWGD